MTYSSVVLAALLVGVIAVDHLGLQAIFTILLVILTYYEVQQYH